jgi:hypothetical protein
LSVVAREAFAVSTRCIAELRAPYWALSWLTAAAYAC